MTDQEEKTLDEYTLRRVLNQLELLRLKYETLRLTFPKVGEIGSLAVRDAMGVIERMKEDV